MVWALAVLVVGAGALAVSYHGGRDLRALLVAVALVLIGLAPARIFEWRGAPAHARAFSPAVFGLATIIIGVTVIQPVYWSTWQRALYRPPLVFATMFDMLASVVGIALGVRGAVGTRGRWRLLALAGLVLCLLGPEVSYRAYDAWAMGSFMRSLAY